MEQQLQINWDAIVEEAIKRRKELKFTQEKLAVLAGISKPTLVRFENRQKNITVKSAFSILNLLGLLAD